VQFSAKILISIISFGFMCLQGCVNPFAPELGDTGGSQIPDAGTIGGMLDLFEYAYNNHDSLIYSQILDSSFVFQYYDAVNSRYDQWYRNTDLKATAGVFNNFQQINLTWYNLPAEDWNFDIEDSLKQVLVNFNLILDNTVLTGFARFDCYKKSGSKFKLMAWKDDF